MEESFISAFAGAFFAFLFLRLAGFLTKIFERKSKNNNSLVRLQYYCNDLLNRTSDNIFTANDFLTGFSEEVLKSQKPILYLNRKRDSYFINQPETDK